MGRDVRAAVIDLQRCTCQLATSDPFVLDEYQGHLYFKLLPIPINGPPTKCAGRSAVGAFRAASRPIRVFHSASGTPPSAQKFNDHMFDWDDLAGASLR